MANVRVIPAATPAISAQGRNSAARRKVAAYARVSTDSDEQLTSYEAQVDYYTKLIQGRSDWQFITVYTDEGISAVNTKRREGFKRVTVKIMDNLVRYNERQRSLPRWHKINDITMKSLRSERSG